MVLPSLTSRITTNRTAAFCLSLGFLTLYFLTISGSLTTRSFGLIKRPTRVNLTQLLTAVPSSQQGASWTDEDGVEAPFAVIGSPILTITFDTSEIIDVVTGEQLAGELDGGLFNLAVIKLPVGSEWDFLGVARGPTRKWSFLEVSGKGAKEQVLVAMGLDIDPHGQLSVVSDAHTLDLSNIPKEGCANFREIYGAEDPRLFWTDAGTPALTFGRLASRFDLCRDIGYVYDVRLLFAPLAKAIKMGEGVKPFKSDLSPGETLNLELVRAESQGSTEKNWAAIFPGAAPSRFNRVPTISYSLAPARIMEPIEIGPRRIVYDFVPVNLPKTENCLSSHHPAWRNTALHHATPVYRLSMCERGCKADKFNTVLFTLGHLVDRKRYAKFFATFNVTSPHNPLSVGPIISINGIDDMREIGYALTMAPVQPSDLDPSSIPPAYTPRGYMPSHFFIDDQILLTMGHHDQAMVSTLISMEDALGRHQMCLPPNGVR